MKKILVLAFAAVVLAGSAATNLVSNTVTITNRTEQFVTYRMTNGVAVVNDPTGRLIGTAEERALKVAAQGHGEIASAAQVAAESARWEWEQFIATNNTHIVYIDAGFTQDLPALAPNLCGWVASSYYDQEYDHYFIWWNREMNYPPSMGARIRHQGGTEWLDAEWVDYETPVMIRGVSCRELKVKRRNANCVLKTGTIITFGGKEGFDVDIHKVNIEVNGTAAKTTNFTADFYTVTMDGTNRVVKQFAAGRINYENGFVKEPTDE